MSPEWHLAVIKWWRGRKLCPCPSQFRQQGPVPHSGHCMDLPLLELGISPSRHLYSFHYSSWIQTIIKSQLSPWDSLKEAKPVQPIKSAATSFLTNEKHQRTSYECSRFCRFMLSLRSYNISSSWPLNNHPVCWLWSKVCMQAAIP